MNRPIASLLGMLSVFAVLSCTRAAAAQELAPDALVVPRLVEPAVRSPRDSHRAGRIALQATTGIAAGILGALPGGLGFAGESVAAAVGGGADDGLLTLSVVGMFGGLLLSDAAAITLSGNALDGRGSFWPTLLGVTLGFAAGFLPLYAAALSGDALDALALAGGGMALGLATSVVGGIVAFELTGDASDADASGTHNPHWSAAVSPVRHGAVAEVSFVI